MHIHICTEKLFCIILIKAICNPFPFKLIANVVVHAILQWFICAKADRDMQCAGLSGAVGLCECVCMRARARACQRLAMSTLSTTVLVIR